MSEQVSVKKREKLISPVFFKEVKNGTGLLIFYSFVFFLIIVGFILSFNGYAAESGTDRKVQVVVKGMSEIKNLFDYRFYELVTRIFCGIFIPIIMIAISFIEASKNFGFLCSRKKSDYYFSQPVSRKCLYYTNLLKGIFDALLPFSVFYIFGMIISLIYGSIIGVNGVFMIIKPMAEYFVYIIAFYIISYILNVIAVILTGRAFTGVCMMGFLQGVVPVGTALITSYPRLQTLPIMQSEAVSKLYNISPIISMFNFYNDYFEKKYMYQYVEYSGKSPATNIDHLYNSNADIDIFPGIFLIIVISVALLTFIGRIIMQKRKTEMSDNAFSFHFVEDIVQGIVTVYGGIILGQLFCAFTSEERIAFLIGQFLGGFITFFIVGFICSLDYKEVITKKKLPVLVTSFVILILLYLIQYIFICLF